ncbi:MAG: YbaN family protein [Bacteroidales bacterium]|nr:YbaN family protein [Bacteroidales bacterium]
MFLLKPVLVFLGTLSLIAGIAGIFIPGLPTTPFLLLTAGLYIRSSEKLYSRLISNRFVGSYISNYKQNNGMTFKSKLYSVALMSLMITVSCIFLIDLLSTRLIVIALGIIGAVVMIFIVPTVKQKSGD